MENSANNGRPKVHIGWGGPLVNTDPGPPSPPSDPSQRAWPWLFGPPPSLPSPYSWQKIPPEPPKVHSGWGGPVVPNYNATQSTPPSNPNPPPWPWLFGTPPIPILPQPCGWLVKISVRSDAISEWFARTIAAARSAVLERAIARRPDKLAVVVLQPEFGAKRRPTAGQWL
jgi:hypothetical protein